MKTHAACANLLISTIFCGQLLSLVQESKQRVNCQCGDATATISCGFPAVPGAVFCPSFAKFFKFLSSFCCFSVSSCWACQNIPPLCTSTFCFHLGSVWFRFFSSNLQCCYHSGMTKLVMFKDVPPMGVLGHTKTLTLPKFAVIFTSDVFKYSL